MSLESDNPIKIGNFYPPQIKVAKTGKYKELTDETYNTQSVQTVSVHKQYFEGSGNLTKEFDEDMHGLSIYNNHTEIMRFVIDGVSIPVFPKGSWNDVFKDPFRSVNIIASGPWYVMPLQIIGAAASIVVPDPPDTTAPDNVTNLTFTATQNSATLNWTASASPDTDGYEIWRSGALVTTVTGTTYNATGLSASTQYTYTVKAKDGAGNVASGTSVNVTTTAQPSDNEPPANVTGLTAGTPTQNGVTLTWVASSSSDVKDYRIYNGSTLIATVTGLTYGVTGLTANTDYTFVVKARDNANNEASGASVNVKTAAPADVTAPVLTITPAATFEDSQQVTMSTNEQADIHFTLDGSTPTTEDTKYTTALTLTDTTTVKAFAKDLAGNESAVQTVVYTKDAEEPSDPTLIIADTFNRADTNITSQGTTTLGTTPVGGAVWTNSSPFLAYGIKNGKAHLQWSGTGGTRHRLPVTVPTNLQNYAVELTFTTFETTDGFESVHFRFGADVMYLRKRGSLYYELVKVLSGASAVTLKLGNIAPTAGDRIRVESYQDGRIRWFVNGVLEYEIKDITGLGATTKVGFGAETVVSEFEDFEVYELSPLPADTTPPGEVTFGNVPVTNILQTQMTITCNIPPDKDFKQIEIYNGETLVATSVQSTTVQGNTQLPTTITNLTANTSYTFTIKTRDWSGNLSSGVDITRSTASGAE